MLYFTSQVNKHTMQSYTEVLREMQDLQQKWRDQTYVLSTEDKERYDLLTPSSSSPCSAVLCGR